MAVTAKKVRDGDSIHLGVCDVPKTLSRDTQSLDERTLVTVAPRGVHTDASFTDGSHRGYQERRDHRDREPEGRSDRISCWRS